MKDFLLRGLRAVFLEKRVPHRIRFAHRYFFDAVYETRLKRSTIPVGTRIHFVYFSCRRDYQLLNLSLQSISRMSLSWLGSVYVFEDDADPFSQQEVEALRRSWPGLVIKKSGRLAWGGRETVDNFLKAFQQVAELVPEHHYIAKVDSDILFFSTQRFETVLRSGRMLIGDGHYDDYGFSQGGLYFMRTDLVKRLEGCIHDGSVDQIIARLGTACEDQVIYEAARLLSADIWLTRLMMFPDEYRGSDRFGPKDRKKFLALHFVKDKHEMAQYFEVLFPGRTGLEETPSS